MMDIDDSTLGAMVKKAMRGIEKSSSHMERGTLAAAAMILASFAHEHGLSSLEINLGGLQSGFRIQVNKNEH